MNPPVCRICQHYHWPNQPHQGNDWHARVISMVSVGDMDLRRARELGVEIPGSANPISTGIVTPVTDVTHSGVRERDAKDSLLDFLKSHPNAKQREIKNGVRARWQEVRRKLTELVGLGVVQRDGAGTRSEPHRYKVGN